MKPKSRLIFIQAVQQFYPHNQNNQQSKSNLSDVCTAMSLLSFAQILCKYSIWYLEKKKTLCLKLALEPFAEGGSGEEVLDNSRFVPLVTCLSAQPHVSLHH